MTTKEAKMGKSDDNTFVKITNADIYKQICELKEEQREHFESITARQDKTNGKVKLSMWIATTAITLGFAGITLLVEHIMRK
jgi:hypothetical protein